MTSPVEADRFRHESLPDSDDHIRLLEVISVDEARDVPVHCKLTTWPVMTAPAYTAISYTWGNPHQLAVILVNGKTLEVRRNCEDVLRQPCRSKGGFFWIDAICINQADDDEKSSQVAMMGDVYKLASQVLACVGRHENDSEFLFEMLRKHERWWKRFRVKYVDVNFLVYQSWRLFMGQSTIVRLLGVLDKFLKRPYFHRVWIYQELFFGEDVEVCCEGQTIRLTLLWGLYLALEMWSVHSAPPRKFVDQMPFMSDDDVGFLLQAGTTRMLPLSLDGVTHGVATLGSENPRDRVYGTLSMIDWEDEQPIFPDYSKDTFDLAVEVFDRIENFGHFRSFISRVERIAKNLALVDQPSDHLGHAIRERRLSHHRAPPTGQTEISDKDEPTLCNFWGKRLCVSNGTWQVQRHFPKEYVDRSRSKLRDSVSFPSDCPLPVLQRWSPEHDWDMSNTDILLSREVRPGDWLLVPSYPVRDPREKRLFKRESVPSDVALIARDSGVGRLHLVGKALVVRWVHWPARFEWERDWGDGACEFSVHLDAEDAFVLAHSCNWQPNWVSEVKKEDELPKMRAELYFETGICGKTLHSYAAPKVFNA